MTDSWSLEASWQQQRTQYLSWTWGLKITSCEDPLSLSPLYYSFWQVKVLLYFLQLEAISAPDRYSEGQEEARPKDEGQGDDLLPRAGRSTAPPAAPSASTCVGAQASFVTLHYQQAERKQKRGGHQLFSTN
ncbi:hypothetical protein P7K49_029580 [Saguinus oedipus]|uniref:Uncharacterized protein n=1 Tax=Saguinus oedipus TaxID=9490 RepID=A0ABQ9U849_SAGOE|nr:hypothetical protein P7K49_029580 [Saguinus oedipus]